MSLDRALKDLLARALGLGSGTYDNGLGAFAGTWTAGQLRELERAVEPFETIDEDVWRRRSASTPPRRPT